MNLRSSLSKWAAAAVIALAGPVLALQPASSTEKKEQKKPAPVVTSTPAQTGKAKPRTAKAQKKTAAKSSGKRKPALAPSTARPKSAAVRLGTAGKPKGVKKTGAPAKKLSAGSARKSTKLAAKNTRPKAKSQPKKKTGEVKATTLHSGKVELPRPKSTLKPAAEQSDVPFNIPPPSTQPSVNTLELMESEPA
jgi:hypothetical protein